MLINDASIDLAFKGFKQVYTDAYLKAVTYADQVAMRISSEARSETYGWIGQFPAMRQWLGPRVVNNLSASNFTITNLPFESTISVRRDDLADDKLGTYKPVFAETGYLARMHPEEMIFGLLVNGFTNKCFDGMNFFDAAHPAKDKAGTDVAVSNMQAGAAAPWFLLDTSREIKPLIWQEREPYTLESVTNVSDYNVFKNNEFLYGLRARANAGYGLWQLAFGSKAALTPANYAAARAAMQNFRSGEGRILGIQPTTLVVPPSLELDALNLLNTDIAVGGAASNPWKATAKLIVTPFAV